MMRNHNCCPCRCHFLMDGPTCLRVLFADTAPPTISSPTSMNHGNPAPSVSQQKMAVQDLAHCFDVTRGNCQTWCTSWHKNLTTRWGNCARLLSERQRWETMKVRIWHLQSKPLATPLNVDDEVDRALAVAWGYKNRGSRSGGPKSLPKYSRVHTGVYNQSDADTGFCLGCIAV